MVPKVELVVLGLLADGPVHGYDLLERFRERSMGFWVEIGRASVYQALARLEAARSITGRARSGVGGPSRREYRITASGRARLRRALAERVGDAGPDGSEAAVALGFAHLMAPAAARGAIEARVRVLAGRVEAVAAERSRIRGERGSARAVADAMLERQEALARAELAWLERARKALAGTRS